MNEGINEGGETTPMPRRDLRPSPRPRSHRNPCTPNRRARFRRTRRRRAAPATKQGVTISHRALWIGGGVALALVLMMMSFGFGVAVGRHTGVDVVRARGGMMLPPPGQGDSGAYGWQGQDPHPWRNGGEGDGFRGGEQGGAQGQRGGPGFRALPRGQFPTGTPSP